MNSNSYNDTVTNHQEYYLMLIRWLHFIDNKHALFIKELVRFGLPSVPDVMHSNYTAFKHSISSKLAAFTLATNVPCLFIAHASNDWIRVF